MAHNDDLDLTDEEREMYDEDETTEKGGRITSDDTYMDENEDDEGFFDDLDMEDEDFA